MNQNISTTPIINRPARAALGGDNSKKGDLQGRSAIIAKMQSDLDSFLGKGSLVFQQVREKLQSTVDPRPAQVAPVELKTAPVPVPSQSVNLNQGNFYGRTASIIQDMKDNLASFLGAGSRCFQHGIETVKRVMLKDHQKPELTLEEIESKEATVPLPSIDMAYLNPKDPAYNLKRLGEMTAQNATESICSEEIFKMVPASNAMSLGYNDPIEYQTILGDQAIVAQVALTALSILGITLGNIFACRASNQYPKFIHCVQSTAEIWQNSSGKTFLAASILLLGVSFYAHNKGWLGRQLYDRSLQIRERKLEALLRDASQELLILAKTNPKESKETATKILKNAELIEATLRVDLGISQTKAKNIVDNLKKACKDILNPNLSPGMTEGPLPTKEMKV
jgi:hypothetical protein